MFCVNVIDIAIKNTLDPTVEGIFMSYFLKKGIKKHLRVQMLKVYANLYQLRIILRTEEKAHFLQHRIPF